MAMIFYFSKKFRKLESDKQAKNWDKFRIPTIRGQTLVIFGYGNIGKAIGKAGKYFGMRVIGVKKNVTEQDGVADEIITVERLHEVIPHADYLVLALPSHASTEDVISEREIFLLKKTAVLINVGRGNCIDEVALANALNEDRIGGAALDVFKVEPLPNDNPLWEAKNLIITPHNSWYTEDAYEIASKLFEVATNQFLSNTQFTAIVDLDRGY